MTPQKVYKRNSGVSKITKKTVFESTPKVPIDKKKKSQIDGFDYSSGVTIKNR